LARRRRFGLLDQRGERLLHGEAGVEQRRELPGEQAELSGGQPARPRLGFVFPLQRRREQSPGAQLRARVELVRAQSSNQRD
jgi:hypothetical protein